MRKPTKKLPKAEEQQLRLRVKAGTYSTSDGGASVSGLDINVRI